MNLAMPPHRSAPEMPMSDGRTALPIPVAIAGAALLSAPVWLALVWMVELVR